MQLIADLLALCKGYRTYAAAIAAILTFLAPLVGVIDPQTGTAAGSALLAAATFFHRMATADIAANIPPATPPSPPVQPG